MCWNLRANATILSEWHARFGHISVDTIKKMNKDGSIDGLNIASRSQDKCPDCALGKCTRTNHNDRSTQKAMKPGISIHMDTLPMMTRSLGGSKYALLAKDEYSGYRFAAFTDTKAQIKVKVKLVIAKAELETNNKVLAIHSDNGTEFVNREL